MKNLIIIAAIILIAGMEISFSQDKTNPPKLDTLVNNNPWVNRNFTGFQLGWNWGSRGRALDEAMNINTYHSFPRDSPYNTGDSMNVIEQIGSWQNLIIGGRDKNYLFNAHCIYLEPTIKVDSTDSFIPKVGDNTGAVFGFNYRNFTIGDTTTDPNRFVLNKNNLSGNSAVVLDSIWKGDILHWLDYNGGENGTKLQPDQRTNDDTLNNDNDFVIYHPFNGKKFYLTINLRALDSAEVEAHKTDTILILRMPYILTHTGSNPTTGIVKFDSVPQTTFLLNRSIISTVNNDFRGKTRLLKKDASQPEYFAITGEMLKNTSSLSVDKSITLSACAFFDGRPLGGGYVNNPRFKNDWWENCYNMTDYISSINVEVEYFGHLDVGIDYIRIETQRNKEIFFGKYDMDIKLAVDTVCGQLASNTTHPRIIRFYASDELLPSQWAANRYYNMLVDTLATVETFTSSGSHPENPPLFFLYATAFKEFWNGSNINFTNGITPPYIKESKNINSCFNFSAGYARGFPHWLTGDTNAVIFRDSTNSEYETHLWTDTSKYHFPIPDSVNIYEKCNDDITFQDSVIWDMSVQYHNEFSMYYNYKMHPKLIFSDKHWWANLWVQSESFIPDNTTSGTFTLLPGNPRPKTGEEIRLETNLPVLLGAKGLIYWLKTSGHWDHPNRNELVRFLGLQSYNNTCSLTGEDLIYSDEIGGDFIKTNNDPNFVNFDINYFDISTMSIPRDRLYVGLKSTRATIYKLNKWIKENEEELMNLNLKSWFSKGYGKWYIQSPELDSNYLSKFISLDKNDWLFKRPKPLSTNNNWQNEGWDSSFFDITLLKDNTKSMDTVFYISALNRRTDPLIYYPDGDSLEFYSTAELEDSCRISKGDTNNWSKRVGYWKNYWWRRLGCREIHIPFDFKNQSDTSEYCLLKVTELGGDLYNDNPTEWWWRAPEYYSYIDTTIGQDRDLVVRLLPGEGKILKVEVLHPARNIVGYLDHSNQTKIVAHPVIRPDSTESDSIRYHAVYYKPIKENCDTLGVYYSRSNILTGNSSNENIKWETPEKLLSYNISPFCINPEGELYDTLSCDRPSIVVRKVNNLLKAFIVYSCYNPDKNTNPFDFIVESVLNVNGEIPGEPNSYIIGNYRGREYDSVNYGNPVINASALGNYYAWSYNKSDDNDTLRGIIAGYRALNSEDICLDDTTFINWDLSRKKIAQHPSMPTYSLIDSSEDNTSIVWQEKNNYNNNFEIMYTRLKYNTSTSILEHYIATEYLSPVKTNGDSVINLSNEFGTIDNQFPVIYRDLFTINYYHPEKTFQFWGSGKTYWNKNRDENVFWSATKHGSVQPSYREIVGRNIGFRDSVGLPMEIRLDAKISFGNNTMRLGQPNLSQGENWFLFFFFGYDFYKEQSLCFIDSLSNKVFCLNLFNSRISSTGFLSTNNQNNILKSYNANQMHLAQFSKTLDLGFMKLFSQDLWKNRRIFENVTSSTPIIYTDAEGLYRQDENSVSYDILAGYFKDTSYFYVGNAFLDGNPLPWRLPYDEIEDSLDNKLYIPNGCDSIKGAMFNVAPMTTADLDFTVFSMSSESTTIGLEGHPSNTFIVLPIPVSTTDSTGTLMQFTFINMSDLDYRIIFINHDTTAEYSERLFIGGLPVGDSIMAKRTENYGGRIIIDLETGQTRKLTEAGKMELKVFPNPAKDEVFVTVNYPVKYVLENSHKINKAKVRLYSITGEKLFEVLARPGETIKIPTIGYTQGLYFIQAEENIVKWQLDYLAPAVDRVYIER